MVSRTPLYLGILVLLVALNAAVAYAVFVPEKQKLTVSFLDVGQGDSILIEGPTGVKMLIDGGPDRSVLRELSKELLPWERRIDVILETHPDKDHIGGLSDVLDRYQVNAFLEPGIPDKTTTFDHLLETVAKEPGLRHGLVRRGMRLHLGGGAYADVLFPDRDESMQKETNDGSVVLHLVYGETSFMLTGDLPSTFEDYLVGLDGSDGLLESDVLKAGHHGSKYSTDSLWLAAVTPKVVVVSAGKGNSYGHPAPETVTRIEKSGARMVSTIEQGTIEFESDGARLRLK